MAGGGELCYSIDDGRVAKVMMKAWKLLQYRWRRSDRGVDDGMDGGLMYSRQKKGWLQYLLIREGCDMQGFTPNVTSGKISPVRRPPICTSFERDASGSRSDEAIGAQQGTLMFTTHLYEERFGGERKKERKRKSVDFRELQLPTQPCPEDTAMCRFRAPLKEERITVGRKLGRFPGRKISGKSSHPATLACDR